MLTTYRGVVKNGNLYLLDAANLPDGTEIILVMQQIRPVEPQVERLAVLSLKSWRVPFDAYVATMNGQPASEDIGMISDEELVELTHEVRAT